MERQVRPLDVSRTVGVVEIASHQGALALARSCDPPPVLTPALSILDDPGQIRPSGDALRDRFARNFTGRGIPKSEQLQPLNLEVVLTPEEAAVGVVLRVGVPVFEVCADCVGTGQDGFSSCQSCGGEGVVAGEQLVPIHIPPLVRPGMITDVLLDGFGVRNLCLRLQTFVTSARTGP